MLLIYREGAVIRLATPTPAGAGPRVPARLGLPAGRGDRLAQDQQRKEKEGEEKANMETLKLIRGGQEFDAKLQQDDEHAKLRASISLAKDGIKQMKATIVDE